MKKYWDEKVKILIIKIASLDERKADQTSWEVAVWYMV